MVAFGQIRKQKTYFGKTHKATKTFGSFKDNSNRGSAYTIRSIEPEQHPLLQNAEVFLKASYSDVEATRKMITLGYTHDTELSNVETNVWLKQGKPLILHRGSSNAKDFLVSDVLLAINRSGLDPRVWSAKKITQNVQRKYNEVADHCGHSLGGAICELVADPLAYVLTYNKGASPYTMIKRISPRQLDIRARGDWISLLSKYQNSNSITIGNKGKGPLDAHNLRNLTV
jgi:hypothetical protein